MQLLTNAPAYEFAEGRDYFAERQAHEAQRAYAERLSWLLVCAAGGPFVQRQPTRAQCRTEALDHYAAKLREGWAGMRSRMVAGRLQTLGLTLAQCEQWGAL